MIILVSTAITSPCVLLLGIDLLKPEALIFTAFLLIGAMFPAMRSLHALLCPPFIRFHKDFIAIRHWLGDWRLFLPWHRFVVDQFSWSDIVGTHQRLQRMKRIVVEHFLSIDRLGKPSVCVHRWVFNRSLGDLDAAIHAELAKRRASTPPVRQLSALFSLTVELRHQVKALKLFMLFAGPAIIAILLPAMLAIDRPPTWLSLSAGVVLSVALVGCLLGIDDLVNYFRFRHRAIWLSRDGIAAGATPLTAKEYRWHEVLGARRRWRPIPEGTPWLSAGYSGTEIYMRDGIILSIPESYGGPQDELVELLRPTIEIELD